MSDPRQNSQQSQRQQQNSQASNRQQQQQPQQSSQSNRQQAQQQQSSQSNRQQAQQQQQSAQSNRQQPQQQQSAQSNRQQPQQQQQSAQSNRQQPQQQQQSAQSNRQQPQQQQQSSQSNRQQPQQTSQSQRSNGNAANNNGGGERIDINVKCVYPDHEDGIMGICFKPNCEKKSRLVCFTCAISNHHDHAQYIVRLSDMSKSDDLFIRNWPSNQQAHDINGFLESNTSDRVCQKIDDMFDKYQQQVITQIERSREAIKVEIKKKMEKNDKVLKELYKKLDDTYNLQGTKQFITELNNQPDNLAQFEKKLQDFLTGKNTQVHQIELEKMFQEKKKKIHEHFNPDLLSQFMDKSITHVELMPSYLWPKEAKVKVDNKGNQGVGFFTSTGIQNNSSRVMTKK